MTFFSKILLFCSVVSAYTLSTTTSVFALSPQDTITLYGSNFVRGSQVRLNNGAIPTIYVSPTILKVVVPTGVPAGRYPVSVVNPALGGGTSSDAFLTIVSAPSSDLAMTYSYQTKQTVFQVLDSSRGVSIMPRDTALLWARMAPFATQTSVAMDVNMNGTFTMTINDVSETTSAYSQPKRIVITSADSIITSYDNTNTVISRIQAPKFESFLPMINGIRTSSSPPAFLGGIVPNMPNVASMQQFIDKAQSEGASIQQLGNGRTQITTTPVAQGSIPPNTIVVTTVNTQTNTIELQTLSIGGILRSKTTYLYDTVGTTNILKATITESPDQSEAGTYFKIVLVTEYFQVRFANYVQPQ
jgi:hypothetical protein